MEIDLVRPWGEELGAPWWGIGWIWRRGHGSFLRLGANLPLAKISSGNRTTPIPAAQRRCPYQAKLTSGVSLFRKNLYRKSGFQYFNHFKEAIVGSSEHVITLELFAIKGKRLLGPPKILVYPPPMSTDRENDREDLVGKKMSPPKKAIQTDTLNAFWGSKKFILHCINRFTKFPSAKMVNNTSSNSTISFLNDYCYLHGFPRKIRVDHGSSLHHTILNLFVKSSISKLCIVQ